MGRQGAMIIVGMLFFCAGYFNNCQKVNFFLHRKIGEYGSTQNERNKILHEYKIFKRKISIKNF